jgi:hypothetical protein
MTVLNLNYPEHLFDPDAAREARDEAVDRVEAHADNVWLARIRLVIWSLAMSNTSFTTDDVWRAADELAFERPHEKRAIGAAMQDATKRGWITKTDKVKPSVRPMCHARPIAIWGSRLVRGGVT